MGESEAQVFWPEQLHALHISPAPLTPEEAEMMQPLPSEASEVFSDSELEIPGQFSSDSESPVVSESEWTDNDECETNQPTETDR